MLRTEPGPERAHLQFTETVRSSFGFLEKRGFACVKADPTFVRYESDRAFVNVYHGRSSYELAVEIGRLEDKPHPAVERAKPDEAYIGRPNREDSFTIWDISRYAGAPDVTETTFLQASTPERVRALVPKLAELVQRYAEPALKGDAGFLEQVREWRSEESRRSRRKDELRRTRGEAARAWREKDYRKVVTLLEPFQFDLTPSESKKLAYAKERFAI